MTTEGSSNQEAFLEVVNQVVKHLGRPGKGYDTNDTEYNSLLAMWKHEGMVKQGAKRGREARAKAPAVKEEGDSSSSTADQPSKPLSWYTEAFAYWEVRMTAGEGLA